MNVGIFAVITLVSGYDDKLPMIDDFRGLIYRSPLLGGLLIFFLVSLVGIPFTGGFFGKFYSFSAAVDGGAVALAIIGLLNSGLAAAYYLRLALVSAQRPPASLASPPLPRLKSASPWEPPCCWPLPQLWSRHRARRCAPCGPIRRANPCKPRLPISARPAYRPARSARIQILKQSAVHASFQPTPPFRYNFINEARRIGKSAGRRTPRRCRPRNHRRQRD
jgi:hypothetical protein